MNFGVKSDPDQLDSKTNGHCLHGQYYCWSTNQITFIPYIQVYFFYYFLFVSVSVFMRLLVNGTSFSIIDY